MKRISFLLVFLCTLTIYAQIDVQNNVVTGKLEYSILPINKALGETYFNCM